LTIDGQAPPIIASPGWHVHRSNNLSSADDCFGSKGDQGAFVTCPLLCESGQLCRGSNPDAVGRGRIPVRTPQPSHHTGCPA